MTESSSSATTRTAEDVSRQFHERFGVSPEVVVRAPGRINLLGAHIDYSDGWVLPVAVDRSIWLAARRRPSGPSRLAALQFDDELEVDLARPPAPATERDEVIWADYPRGVAWVLGAEGFELPQIDVVFGGDVPIGAGVSSSAAVEVAFFLALESLAGFALEGVQRAQFARRVENDYVGVQSGIMDQFASIHGQEQKAVLIDCRSLEHDLIPVPTGVSLLVSDTRVRRTLAGSSFNDRKSECFEAVALLREVVPGLQTLRDLTPEQLDEHQGRLPSNLAARARHVVSECRRVLEGAEALRQGDLQALGERIRSSHVSSRDDYDVSIPELDVLAETAWSSPGCYGARLAGAGFGGCTMSLVDEDSSESVRQTLLTRFEEKFGKAPKIFECRIGGGAEVVG